MKKNRIISIMTTFYPNRNHFYNAKKICDQSDFLIICDNSPTNNKELFSGLKNIKYFYWGKNLGLSMAFNFVLKDGSLNWCDTDYIIFFDQDSTIPKNHIKYLVEEYKNLLAQGESVGCIGPVYFDLSSNREEIPHMKTFVNRKSMRVSSIITTSMLCQYRILKKIGFWNDDIFLDMADWDICWRLQANQLNVYLTYASIIRHSVGQGTKKVGPLNIRVGKPFREYYQTRECLQLLFKDYVPFKYKLRFIAMLTIRPIMHFLFLDNKWERIKYITKGIIDYFKGKRGSL